MLTLQLEQHFSALSIDLQEALLASKHNTPGNESLVPVALLMTAASLFFRALRTCCGFRGKTPNEIPFANMCILSPCLALAHCKERHYKVGGGGGGSLGKNPSAVKKKAFPKSPFQLFSSLSILCHIALCVRTSHLWFATLNFLEHFITSVEFVLP